ncbi:MAG: copper resistance protein CopC [Rhodoluna sp.]|nr:copper resistance protein CopC [Rhodoluna sp.]
MNKLTRLIAAGIIVVATSFTPTASFAHAEVVSSTPAAGSTVEAGYVDIDIEFNEDLLQSPDSSGSEIQIVDNTTKELVTVDCVRVDGAHLIARAALFSNGPVKLTWRTVSDDGHAMSESYDFNVTNPDGLNQGTGSMCAVEKMNVIAPAPASDDTKRNDSSGGLLGLGVGVAFIVVFAVIGGIQTKRRLDKEASKNK